MATKNSMKLLVPLATAGLAAVVTFGSGATFTSVTGPKTLTVTAGKILTTLGDGQVALDITDLQPGESVVGTVDISNGDATTHTLDGTLKFDETAPTLSEVVDANSNPIDLSSYLTLKVEYETAPGNWIPLDADALNNTAASTLQPALAYPTGTTAHYRFTASLASGTPNEVQGATAQVGFTWTATATSNQAESWNGNNAG